MWDHRFGKKERTILGVGKRRGGEKGKNEKMEVHLGWYIGTEHITVTRERCSKKKKLWKMGGGTFR